MNSPFNKDFEAYFGNIYQSRWPKIKSALVAPEKQVIRRNQFIQFSELQIENLEKCFFLENCFWKPESYKLEKNNLGHYPFYLMDPASVIVAKALDPQADDEVLDLCAAPGGKTLILAEQMSFAKNPQSGTLISNEFSQTRRERLTRVLHEFIPKEKRQFIFVKGLDGNQYGLKFPESYDRILADVPCSGERHLLENQKELALWSVKRTKNLAIRQYSLLSSAWLSLKAGGRLVYSTCSISPEENDAVIGKLIKKRDPKILELDWLNRLDFIEKTEWGYQILPDKAGFGPMYFSIIEKP